MAQGNPQCEIAHEPFSDESARSKWAGVSRDPHFKLVDIALVRLAPIIKTFASRVAFSSVGFESGEQGALHAIYLKNGMQPVDPAFLDIAPLQANESQLKLPFLCLSLAGDALSLASLESILGSKRRPGLIHIADCSGGHHWLRLRQEMIGMGYAPIGALEGAEVFIDSPVFNAVDLTDRRPEIRSFDVFDTLIARRCVDPWRVFQTVGEIANLPDFVEQRRAAEKRVMHFNYRLDDIYSELSRHYGWTVQECSEFQALEYDCEMQTVIPIAENLARVKDGDLLVSDMYLSEKMIRGLLVRAGLQAQVGLIVESHGKSSGRVWPSITDTFNVTRHLGDNPHADVAVPSHLGIDAELTRASELGLVEQTLLQAGLPNLALLCREARLASWSPNSSVRGLQLVQCALNFPILLLASVFVSRRATELGCTKLLFSSRDCNLWLPLFDKVQPHLKTRFETTYFLTSRLARKTGSDAYLEYARRHLQSDALVIDLCGTGWSMANLAETLGLERCNVFLIDHCPPFDLFERAKKTPDTCRIHTMFEKRPSANNVVLELANMADHGMIVDMLSARGALVPVVATTELSTLEALAVKEQRQCFMACISLLDRYDFHEVLALDDASIAHLCGSLYEYLSRQADLFQLFAKGFLEENAKIVQRLVQ